MKTGLKVGLVAILIIAALAGLTFGLGWFGVGYTKTVGKAQQNADREVWEQSQSRVGGKKLEATKLYKEYRLAETEREKKIIANTVSISFSDFDENLLPAELRKFVYDCKYN